jgi:hypothetical protein
MSVMSHLFAKGSNLLRNAGQSYVLGITSYIHACSIFYLFSKVARGHWGRITGHKTSVPGYLTTSHG